MPRKQKDPIVEVMQYFETASLESARTALEVVIEIVRRRTTTRPGKPGKAEQPAPPMRSRAEEVVEAFQETAPALPKARVRKPRQEVIPQERSVSAGGGLPGIQTTVGE